MKKSGICHVCGCTPEEACGWANTKKTLCSACLPLSDTEREEKRVKRLADLLLCKTGNLKHLDGTEKRTKYLAELYKEYLASLEKLVAQEADLASRIEVLESQTKKVCS